MSDRSFLIKNVKRTVGDAFIHFEAAISPENDIEQNEGDIYYTYYKFSQKSLYF